MMRVATLVLAVTAMSGLPKAHIKAPAAYLEVLPNGNVAHTGSLVETGAAGITRGQVQANENFAEDHLKEEREVEQVEESFKRETSVLQRTNGPEDLDTFVSGEVTKAAAEVAEIKEDLNDVSRANVQQEEILDHETKAEVASRTDTNNLKSTFSELEDQATSMITAQTDLKDDSEKTAEETNGLKDSDRTEGTGMASLEGEMDLLRQQITNIQDVVGHKLNELSEGMEKLHASGFGMTDGLNRNGNFMKDLVHTLAQIDNQASREVDATVELLRQIHLVDVAKEAEAAAKAAEE